MSLDLLRTSLPLLSASDANFASSLLAQYDRKGSLSDKQLYWVNKLAERATTPAPERVKVGSMLAVYALFTKAREHLKWPKVVLTGGFDTIRISVAGPNARIPGSINVVVADTRDWCGRILSDGTWEPSRKLDEKQAGEIQLLLTEFAADPAGVAARHGRLTGNCCFCNSGLKDERSTDMGYGPVCAKNFGLPWGARH